MANLKNFIVWILCRIIHLLCDVTTKLVNTIFSINNMVVLEGVKLKALKQCCTMWKNISEKMGDISEYKRISDLQRVNLIDKITETRNILHDSLTRVGDEDSNTFKRSKGGRRSWVKPQVMGDIGQVYNTKDYYISMSIFNIKFKMEMKKILSYYTTVLNIALFVFSIISTRLYPLVIWFIRTFKLETKITEGSLNHINLVITIARTLTIEALYTLRMLNMMAKVGSYLLTIEQRLSELSEMENSDNTILLDKIKSCIDELIIVLDEMCELTKAKRSWN